MIPGSAKSNEEARKFVRFAAISGIGWLCDIATFSALVWSGIAGAFYGNIVSSYAGVTFVWFTALGAVFARQRQGSSFYLMAYWGYQLVSILIYSKVIESVAGSVAVSGLASVVAQDTKIMAKIMVTPFNLVTNYLFMRYLARSLRPA